MLAVTQNYKRELNSLFWENHFPQDEKEIDRLAQFGELLVIKNEQVNLISRNDTANLVENHIFISAYISKFFPEKCSNFLDIGTGGGFPGLPIAIVNQNLKGVLVDSISKKINAVSEFINKLKLINVCAVNDRVESKEFVDQYKDTFDLIVSRATIGLDGLVRDSLPLIKSKAYIAAIKGGDLSEEIDRAMLKYKSHIKKYTIYELAYKPTNIRNQKDKKLVLVELEK